MRDERRLWQDQGLDGVQAEVTLEVFDGAHLFIRVVTDSTRNPP
jgi:hypothetical protein